MSNFFYEPFLPFMTQARRQDLSAGAAVCMVIHKHRRLSYQHLLPLTSDTTLESTSTQHKYYDRSETGVCAGPILFFVITIHTVLIMYNGGGAWEKPSRNI